MAEDVEEVIGLISDTHGVLEETAMDVLRGASNLVIHAGDVGDHRLKKRLSANAILELLRERTKKRVEAVRGNVDGPGPGISGSFLELPNHAVISAAGKKILVIHISGFPPNQTEEAKAVIGRERPDIVVFGHSHVPGALLYGDTLYINPGSAGPRRFRLPRCLALLKIFLCGGVEVRFIPLSDHVADQNVSLLQLNLSCSEFGKKLEWENFDTGECIRCKNIGAEIEVEAKGNFPTSFDGVVRATLVGGQLEKEEQGCSISKKCRR